MQQSALLQAKAYYLVKPTEFGSSLLILKRDSGFPMTSTPNLRAYCRASMVTRLLVITTGVPSFPK